MSEHVFPARSVRPRQLEGDVSRSPHASPLTPLAVAALCALGMAVIWMLAELVPALHMKDAVLLNDVAMLSRPRLDSVGNFLLHLLDPSLFILWGIALAAVAVARERTRVAVAVVGVLVLAPLSAERLKPLLAHPHDQVGYVHIGAASWPSGHATAAAALALCAVLVAPQAIRLIVAGLGAVFVAAVGFSLLMLGWHMPSDVLGGCLLAGLWMALAVSALRILDRRRAPRDPTAARSSAPS
jgi:membrane-associated phospholipid phosphatase